MKQKFRVEMISFPTEPKVKLVECSQCRKKVNDGYNLYERKQGAKPVFFCNNCYKDEFESG